METQPQQVDTSATGTPVVATEGVKPVMDVIPPQAVATSLPPTLPQTVSQPGSVTEPPVASPPTPDDTPAPPAESSTPAPAEQPMASPVDAAEKPASNPAPTKPKSTRTVPLGVIIAAIIVFLVLSLLAYYAYSSK
jgi:hypothetical protein